MDFFFLSYALRYYFSISM